MELKIDDILANLSERGQVEWALARAYAENRLLNAALQATKDEKRDNETE